jgi:hypothetical protein
MSDTPPDISVDMIALFNVAMMRIFGQRYMNIDTNTSLMLIPTDLKNMTPDLKNMTPDLTLKKYAYIMFLKANKFVKFGDSPNTLVLSNEKINGDKNREKFLKNVREFITKMEVQINPHNNSIEVTLHDRIRRGTIVDKKESIEGGIIADPSYHCESLKLFVAILTAGFYLSQPILIQKNVELTFKFSKGLFGSGLVESVKICSGKTVSVSAEIDPVSSNLYRFQITVLEDYSKNAAKDGAGAPEGDAAAHNDTKLRIEQCSTKPDQFLGICRGKNIGFLRVDFDLNTTVGNLKFVIQDKLGIPFDNQYLLFNANETSVELTDNNRTLHSYGIINTDSRIEFYDLTADKAKAAPSEGIGGRSRRKSKTTRRRKHRRKTHHKHARKTRHKRTHRSRATRKHKKYSRKH